MKKDTHSTQYIPKRIPDGFRDARIIMAAVIILILLALIWLGKNMVQPEKHRTLTVYCFTGMEKVMEDAVFPEFKQYWLEKNGESVEFIPTFAGSGAITEKIISRFPAEITILSSRLDAMRLSERGIAFRKQANNLPNGGIINRTPIVILTRPGNPFSIEDFEDLTQSGLGIAYPDPETSGAGQLGIIAIYGSRIKKGGTSIEALDELKDIWVNIVDKPSSASVDLQHFMEGTGDVLITYESNLLANPKRKRIEGDIIYPDSTVICEPTVRAIAKNVTPKQQDLVEAFVAFLWSEKAQQAFVDYGTHSIIEPLNESRKDLGSLEQAFTIEEIGNPDELRRIADAITHPLQQDEREESK